MSGMSNLFYNLSRIGNDTSDTTNRHKQNIESANYILENYSAYNSMNNAMSTSVNQPNVFVNGSLNGGINRNNIDTDSMLHLTHLTKGPERSIYQERLFSTVPYLGKGPGNVDIEDRLIGGDLNINRKSTDPNSEVSQIDHIYYPLIPSIESTISNPKNLVEGVAASGWVRGGVPSRILNRDEDEN